jgi:predicted lipase
VKDLKELFQAVHEVDNLSDLLNLAKQFPKTLLDNTARLVRDDQLFGFIAKSKSNANEIFVVLRGTREQAEWFNNFRPVPKIFLEEQKNKFGDLGEVRNGFNRIYSEKREGSKKPTIKETITKLFENQQDLLTDGCKVFVSGHSLGAGLATLAALHIGKIADIKGVKTSINLYTFASPRVGDETFAKKFDELSTSKLNALQCYRIINSEDLIQAVPFPTTQVVDDAIFDGMNPAKKARTLWARGLLETITNGQSTKHYQHVGIPVTFTKQKGTISGNHNLTNTYRKALNK